MATDVNTLVSCGYCKDCIHRKQVEYNTPGKSYGICTNASAIDEDYGQENTDAMLIYSYQEGGSFYVGERFGCVHFEGLIAQPKAHRLESDAATGGNMDDEKVKKQWLVKGRDGEYISITADSWVCGGNGLKFYLGDTTVAWFISWQHFREVLAT